MTKEEKILELKALLALEIQKENSDNNSILTLSSEIAKLDESNVRFSVDAGIINRLGKELVGRQETAVSELVKNAYDADSTEVQLIFENAWDTGGILHIVDNGVGMTREQLINGFMRISSSDKIHNPTSPKYLRVRAGRKGIGRFATQRLGEKLTIVTQTQNSSNALRLSIDWNHFETDKDLSTIASSIEVIPKGKEEGTDLIIENLREYWTDSMIKRVYRYTSELLQPFPLSKIRVENEEARVDPGFQSSYFRKDADLLTKIVDEDEAFLKHALGEIEGYVLDNGQGCWALKSDKLSFPQEVFLIGKDKDLPESTFSLIKGVHFKCYYFIYESSLLPPQQMSFIREVAQEKGGIRLYRNGFRVLPYGERGDDWIGLDASVRRRVILPPHGNINLFGFIELSDRPDESLFEETSSREGLIESNAFHELVDFTFRSITSAIMKIAELRNKKTVTSAGKEPKKDPTAKVDSAITKIQEALQEIKKPETDPNSLEIELTDSSLDTVKISEAISALIEGREEEKKERQKLIEENNMLRILAGLGLVIGEFVHEVKRFLPAFDTDTRYLRDSIQSNIEANQRLNRLETNIKSFTAYTSYFDKAISRNVLRELQPMELRDAVNDFIEIVKNDLERTGIILNKPLYEGFDLFTVPMHPSEWASILFNFYTNSKKAIRRKGLPGNLFIRCGRENDNLFLEFSDNGDGIPKQNAEDIFNAFFTTSSSSSSSASDAESLSGTGLGLKIIRDIIQSYGGSVFVHTPEKNYSTTLRIEIPENKSNENE